MSKLKEIDKQIEELKEKRKKLLDSQTITYGEINEIFEKLESSNLPHICAYDLFNRILIKIEDDIA
ncbi:MAG: hypothetical protein ACTSQS_18450 [Promethearchaeota archaeon]